MFFFIYISFHLGRLYTFQFLINNLFTFLGNVENGTVFIFQRRPRMLIVRVLNNVFIRKGNVTEEINKHI